MTMSSQVNSCSENSYRFSFPSLLTFDGSGISEMVKDLDLLDSFVLSLQARASVSSSFSLRQMFGVSPKSTSSPRQAWTRKNLGFPFRAGQNMLLKRLGQEGESLT